MNSLKMEVKTSTPRAHHSKNSAAANSHISSVKESETSIGDVSLSFENFESANLTDELSPATCEFLSFPLPKKKKRKIPFAPSLEQTDNCKNREFLSSTTLHLSQDPRNLECEDETVQLKNKLYEYTEGKTSVESQISDKFSQMSLHASKEFDDFDIDMNFEGAKKKKKKSTKQAFLTDVDDDTSENRCPERKMPVAERLFYSSDSDYTYDYLLARFYRIAKQERPTMESTSIMKLTIKPPLIFRVGSKKTSFANFIEICKVLHRPPQHLMSFLLAELGTSGSLDGNNHLIIKGRFQQKQFEYIIRRYIKEYVRCFTCCSLSTVMQKEIRLTFLMCENCESRRSVASIKSGFQAVTGKRAAMRAKTVA